MKSEKEIASAPVSKVPEPDSGQSPTIATPDQIFAWGRKRGGPPVCVYAFIEKFASTIVLQNCVDQQLILEGKGGDGLAVSTLHRDVKPTMFTLTLSERIVLEPGTFFLIPASTYFSPHENADLAEGKAGFDVKFLVKGREKFCVEVLVFVPHKDRFRIVPLEKQSQRAIEIARKPKM